jgi:hypothetical protein
MKSYEAGAVIDATPARVWQVLTDGSRSTAWDSGVEKLEGTIATGRKIKVFSEVSPGRAFPVTVSLRPEARMTWTGGMPMRLFKGVRTFTIEPLGEGTRFDMREKSTGPLLGVIWRSMTDRQPSFDTFAAGLEAEAERTP